MLTRRVSLPLSTAGLFDELRDVYDSWYKENWLLAEMEVSTVARLLRKRPVLEVGVGSGFFAKRLEVENGVDPSIGMLELALKRGIEVVQGIGEKLPYRNSSFNTILLIVTLCFVDDVDEVLRESHRVLRNGGDVISCIIPRESPWGQYYLMLAREGHPFYSRARFLSVNELVDRLEKARFRVDKMLGVLSFGPLDKPRWEEPSEDIRGKGFVCIRAVKE